MNTVEAPRLAMVELARPCEFSSPFEGGPFVVWIVAEDAQLKTQEMADIVDSLVREGGRLAVFSGLDSSAWDDAIDCACLERADVSAPRSNFVMTSWHENEPAAEISDFFVCNTGFDDFSPPNFLVPAIGTSGAGVQPLAETRRRLETSVMP